MRSVIYYKDADKNHVMRYVILKYGKRPMLQMHTGKRNHEGIKVWKIMHRMGTYNGYNKYDNATYFAVKSFQHKHHLKVTGNVNEATWAKMGFSRHSWKSIDSYVAPIGANAWHGRSAHIEAMIKQAQRYMGKPYLFGSYTSPALYKGKEGF